MFFTPIQQKHQMWQKNICQFILCYIEIRLIRFRNKCVPVYELAGKQEWWSGESSCLPPMWPSINSGLMSYVGKVFLWVLRFSSLHKNQHSKFQFNQDRRPAKAAVVSSLKILIYFYLI